MKKVLVGAMALLTLAACSNEEVLQKNEVNQEIGFTAVTGKALSRANDGYCNKFLPKAVNVTASYASNGSEFTQYFLNDAFILTGTNTLISSGSVRYWPALDVDGTKTQKLKFFATTAKDGNDASVMSPVWDGGYTSMKLEDYTVVNDVSKQHDLLYAVTTVNSKPTDGLQTINFRHALSQIEFQAKNSNSNIHVEICGVSVVNVNSKGTFKFSADTDDNYEIHDSQESERTEPTNVGSWPASSIKETYAVTFNPTVIGTGATSLTVANDGEKEYSTNTMYLIPQTIIPWNKTGYAKPTEDPAKGTYFLVKAKIWNIADEHGVFNSSTDVMLWGSGSSMDASNAKDIAVPANSITWAPGKRYVYTFEFTASGNGGTDPGTGHEVLTPIKLSVTVDDFVDAGEISVPLTK